MQLSSNNTAKVAKNSLLLYVRMIIVMIINLYTVRLVLNAIGSEDYGIYDVVTGVITIFISISSVFSTTTQRFYAFAIGQNNSKSFSEIFSVSLILYILLSIFVIIVGETIGLWFLNNYLVIPDNKIIAANWIFQFSIITFVLTILQIPYSSAIIAHENMGIFALVSLLECSLKMVTAALLYNFRNDRLIYYGLSILLTALIIFIIYVFWTHKKYSSCRYLKPQSKSVIKELLSFSGWTFFGSIASVGFTQIITLMINIFFGPLLNTARAISQQFNFAITSMTSSFLMALRPQMTKSYAEGSYLYLNKIFNYSNKIIYYSLLIITLPLLFKMDVILLFWLKSTDQNTILFSRLIVVYTLIMALNNPISIIVQATGRVREYHLYVELFTLLSIPITFVAFKLGSPAYISYVIMIVATIIAHIIRIYCLKRYYSSFNLTEYLSSFILPATLITIITTSLLYIINKYYSHSNNILFSVELFFISTFLILLLVFIVGLTKNEKGEIFKLVLSYTNKNITK